MPEITTRLGLKKPLGNETFNRQSYNENLDLIDQSAETPAAAQAKATAAETAAKAYTDQEIGTVNAEVSAHLADNVRHVTQTEKNTWNAKQNALGYTPVPNTRKINGKALSSDITLVSSDVGAEPAFSKNSAFNKNFGTAAGTVCQGNDNRLSNSRKCNNTFDNAATARTNLGLTGTSNTTHYHDGRYAQTRVYNGVLQYYDGGWKDVGIIATQPRNAFLRKADVSGNIWYTALDITGHGIIERISLSNYSSGLYNELLEIRLTIDGISCIYGTGVRSYAFALGGDSDGGSDMRIDVLLHTEFKTSLKIESRHTEIGYTETFDTYADYGLI